LFLAWRYGNEDPYRLYHGLDAFYRPQGGGDPKPPPNPDRLRNFIFGMARCAEEMEVRLAGGKVPARRMGR
jgi:hypothetical protein